MLIHAILTKAFLWRLRPLACLYLKEAHGGWISREFDYLVRSALNSECDGTGFELVYYHLLAIRHKVIPFWV